MIDYQALKALAAEIPELLKPTRDGLFTLESSGKIFHSSYSPAKEAARLVEGISDAAPEDTLLFILGAGLGYHIELLERAGFKRMIVIEQDPAAARIFEGIYKLPEESHLIGPFDGVSGLDSCLSLLEIQNYRRIKTVVLRGGYHKDLYAPFEERIERLLKVKLGDFSTRLQFEELWFIQILKNLAHFSYSGTVSTLFGRLKNVPMVIVSAGPSLAPSIPWLKKIAPHALICAVDTAVLPLDEGGVKPDIIYSLDSQVHNLNDFLMVKKETLRESALIYDLVVNPELVTYFRDCGCRRLYASNTAHLDIDAQGNPFLIKNELVNFIEARGGFRIGDIETGGSVSTSAFHFAYLTGADPIILVGQDLAYSYQTSHSPSSSHLTRVSLKTDRLKPIGSVFMDVMRARKVFPVQSLGGGEVMSDFVLNNFRGWLEESASSIRKSGQKVRLINGTLSGASITHFEHPGLKELEAMLLKSPPLGDRKKCLSPVLQDPHKLATILTAFDGLADFLKTLPATPELFDRIAQSPWTFLKRYFMKEESLCLRYHKVDAAVVRRKIRRLEKTLEGLKAWK